MVVVRNAQVLTHDYIPPRLPHREKEYSELIKEFKLMKHGFPPPHLAILGPTGSGKTVTVRKALVDTGIDHVYLIAESTAYGTLVALGEMVLGKRKWGLSFAPLWNEIDSKLPKPCIIVLDEAEKFMTRDEKSDHLLYYLSRRPQTGLILISNRLNLLDYIRDSRVKSSYKPRTILFTPYNADEIYSIILERTKEAIGEDYESYVDEAALKYIAALAAQKGGDARYAIDLLREGLKQAILEDSPKLIVEHIDKARTLVEVSYVESSLRMLSRAHKLLLLVILKGAKRVGEAYSKFNELAPSYGLKQLSERRLRDVLGDLELMGFIRVKRMGRQWIITISSWIPTEAKTILEKDLKLAQI